MVILSFFWGTIGADFVFQFVSLEVLDLGSRGDQRQVSKSSKSLSGTRFCTQWISN